MKHAIRVLLLSMTLVATCVMAQGITSQQADAILQELRQIRTLLERGAAPAGAQAARPAGDAVSVRIDGAFTLGKANAPVTMVEFTDYECPFCRSFHNASFEAIKRKYIDTGKVRYVSRDFPLEFHPRAVPAARMARCAGDQGRFWEMRHALFGSALDNDRLLELGRDLKLDMPRLERCFAAQGTEMAVQEDMGVGRAAGVSGTPTFVIGRAKGDTVEGTRVVGAQPLATFESRIEALLAQK